MSSFMKAASIAWLKEFWKLGTGTRSELSLSPSLSIGAGGTKLFSSKKYQCYNSGNNSRDLHFLKGAKFPLHLEGRPHLSLEQFWATHLLLLSQLSASAKVGKGGKKTI